MVDPIPTRQRLLTAAAELVAAAGGRDVSLRAICDRAGVRLPSLYHHFGSKEGLIEAVIAHGFAVYLERKRAMGLHADPIATIAAGWDAHVAFGLENPAFYALMYGRIQTGNRPEEAGVAQRMLLGLVRQAAAAGRVRVTPELATQQILAANVGVTLALLTTPDAHPDLSSATRDGVLAAICQPPSDGAAPPDAGGVAWAAVALRAALQTAPTDPGPLDGPERGLLLHWLRRLESG